MLVGMPFSGNATALSMLQKQLADIIDLVRTDIEKLVRCTLEALIVIFVHNRDTASGLYKKGVYKEQRAMKQDTRYLRRTSDGDDTCVGHVCPAQL